MKKNLPIGVFDSGIGGLTVLYRLIEMFPNEDFVYVGDTLNLPYGTKTKEQLRKLVSNVSNYLNELPVKSIVIACNTATTNSGHLKETLDLPIIGVIEPTANYALNISENILVLATNVTIDSNAYQDIINANKKDPNSKQFYLKCSDFVDAIESNEINTPYSYKLVQDKLEAVKNEKIDVIICGCTHFGLYEKELKSVFPNAVVLECALPTGLELKKQLENNDLLNDKKEKGKTTINVTKLQDNFEAKTKWFDHPYDGVNQIKVGE